VVKAHRKITVKGKRFIAYNIIGTPPTRGYNFIFHVDFFVYFR